MALNSAGAKSNGFAPALFDDQLLCETDEVDRVGTDRDLAAEFVAVKLFGAKETPEMFFRGCGIVAERTGEVALFLVSVHSHVFTPSPALPSRGRKPD